MPAPSSHAAYLERCAQRRSRIYAHWRDSKSLDATAKAFQISRQRVHQIVNQEKEKDQDGQDRTGGSDTPPPARAAVDG